MSNAFKAQDTIAAKMGECYVTINGETYNFAQCKNIELKMNKDKKAVEILGRVAKGHKSYGCDYEGKMTMYYNTSVLRSLLAQYKDTGVDIYFDMQTKIEDPTTSIGKEILIVNGCNLNGGLLAKFDAAGDILEEDVEFTFEDYQINEKFSKLRGM